VFIPSTQIAQVFFFNPQVLDRNGRPTLQALSVPVLHLVASRPGGDTQSVANVEYRIPIIGPVTFGLFLDAGMDGILRKNQLQLDPSALSTLRQQFPNPDFPRATIPTEIPIAPGTNFHLRSSTGAEIVVQLPIVNAPFRFYYAYNLNRLKETIVEPTGAFFLSDQTKQALPPGVLQSTVLPQLQTILATQPGHFPGAFFEPRRTFKFTVSRTF
jgi:outer membrane protein insertion porin family